MSHPYNGKDMDRPYNTPGSVKRAREQIQDMLARDREEQRRMQQNSSPTESSAPLWPPPPGYYQSRFAKNRMPPGQEPKSDQPISRPIQVPQWPLTNSSTSPPAFVDPSSYRPASPKSEQMTYRPPRPSQSGIPSILDQSKLQQPNPAFTSQSVFLNSPQEKNDNYSVFSPSAPSEGSTRQTISSVGSIPDFPIPIPASSSAPIRKSANLGPPPSSRRGASSFYSSASLVSPIPEESPRSRSHESYASSAAMPETWPIGSPEMGSPGYGDAFYDDSVTEKSRESGYDEFGDESQLVRSASLGKKGKPALITTKGTSSSGTNTKQDQAPARTVFENGGYMSPATSSSETVPTIKKPQASFFNTLSRESLAADAILQPYGIASSSDSGESVQLRDVPRQQTRLSGMKRPPRLDIDAVRAAEARGSLTSLPDLIRRATRLAAMIDKGKRPASRLDTMEGYLTEKDDPHRSGLSDMLAAFPPPVHTPRNNASRSSWRRSNIWPAASGQEPHGHSRSPSGQIETKPKRRCCGLPLWLVILLVFLLLILIVAAIVVPLEFLVFKNLGQKDNMGLSIGQCQERLACKNGGTSVILEGNCSCICTNGFTGSDCGESGTAGCTTTNLVSADGQSHLDGVTVGKAIVRILADADRNFSVPLSSTYILARFNSGGLSCIAQNSLVTFDGRSTRSGQPTDEVQAISQGQANIALNAEEFPVISIITLLPTTTTTITVTPSLTSQKPRTLMTSSDPSQSTETTIPPTTSNKSTLTSIFSSSSPLAPRSTASTTSRAPAPWFMITEEVLDFSRVAMLYILQQQSVDRAVSSQTTLQRLFSKAMRGNTQMGSQVTEQEASNVDLGNGNSINLVSLSVDIGDGPVGRRNV